MEKDEESEELISQSKEQNRSTEKGLKEYLSLREKNEDVKYQTSWTRSIKLSKRSSLTHKKDT